MLNCLQFLCYNLVGDYMYDVIVIGSGPAGISASLYLKRANNNILVIGNNSSRLSLAHKIENYYGFLDGINGEDLYNNGIQQAKNLGIEVLCEEVFGIKFENNFVVKTNNGEYSSKYVIIATGSTNNKSNIVNLNDYLGRGVSYCAICDGFFFKNKVISLVGNSNYVISECNDLINLSDNINIFTNGEETSNEVACFVEQHPNLKVYNDKIVEVSGDNVLEKVVLENGEVVLTDALFIANGVASTSSIATKLGVLVDNNFVKVNSNYETNVKGCFAIGDAIGGLLQISKCVSDGAICATYINKLLKEDK